MALLAGLVLGQVSVPPARAQDSDYLHGYLDALIDSRAPGLGLTIQRLGADGGVVLHSEACLGPWQQRRLAELLRETGRVTEVEFACPGTAVLDEAAMPLAIDVRALPEQALFHPLIADPRQPRFSMSYQRYRLASQEFAAGNVAFGEYFGLASGFLGRSGSSQIALQGAVFALFNLDAASNDLVNADYWIGVPISYRTGSWSWLFRIYHQSSHLGDEFLLGNPEVERINLSYEDAELLGAHEWERTRIYGGVGYVVHSEPRLAPAHLRGGAEYIWPRLTSGLDFVAGIDLQAAEELDWDVSRSYVAGFEFRNHGTRRLRLLLEYFNGHSPSGQFFREHLRYHGIGLYFGF